jgi:L-alanine-DL-glutamate epimerase-like enolase superfamily enzyme
VHAAGVKIERLDVSAYTVPTDFPESDGTLEWADTTLVLVEAHGGDRCGIGFTYANTATEQLINEQLAATVLGRDAMNVPECWISMVRSIRNHGRPGVSSMGIAAIDLALWDLKARLLELPLVQLLGAVHGEVPIYGSGGFTSYPEDRLKAQFSEWISQGISRVKMKIGHSPQEDLARMKTARQAIGPEAELFVDANGAYDRKQALDQAHRMVEHNVTWFEEPVSSDDLEGLRFLRDHAPARIEISAGEYGYDLPYFQRMLSAGAVDVLQADITRCAGLTEWMRVSTLSEAHQIPLSAHTAPSLHLHPACASLTIRHLEYFHDHVRIEHLFFDGAPQPTNGNLKPDLSRPGCGLEFKRADAEKFAV